MAKERLTPLLERRSSRYQKHGNYHENIWSKTMNGLKAPLITSRTGDKETQYGNNKCEGNRSGEELYRSERTTAEGSAWEEAVHPTQWRREADTEGRHRAGRLQETSTEH